MATNERHLPMGFKENGTPFYPSITSQPDDSVAVVTKLPDHVIPVFFVPGIMGSNLCLLTNKKTQVWRLDNKYAFGWNWGKKGAEDRRTLLQAERVDVDTEGKIADRGYLAEINTAVGETFRQQHPGIIAARAEQLEAGYQKEMRRRGWGTVAYASYGDTLAWLEQALNEGPNWKTGPRMQLVGQTLASDAAFKPLTAEEVAYAARYWLPVHAVGYNWLDDNKNAAARLNDIINRQIEYYRDKKKYKCDRAILVTHSMGGLVARYYSECLQPPQRDTILGVVHGVMPAIGAAAAYGRSRTGWEVDRADRVNSAGAVWALGSTAAEVTAVFANNIGPLQLLPTKQYGRGWLNINSPGLLQSLPVSDPYEEIYLRQGPWWALCDEKLLEPSRATTPEDWTAYCDRVGSAKTFHHGGSVGTQCVVGIEDRYHPNSYVFWGAGTQHKTWEVLYWDGRAPPASKDSVLNAGSPSYPGGRDINIQRPYLPGDPEWKIQGRVAIPIKGQPVTVTWRLRLPEAAGDGTVPTRSGAAPQGKPGVRHALAVGGEISHESAYDLPDARNYLLWAITRIVAEKAPGMPGGLQP